MLQTKQILNNFYQLEQNLAQNPGHQTWIARDLSANPPIPVVVKLLAFSPQMQWEEFKLFEPEAEILKHLNHPHIPRYHDYFSIDKEAGDGLPWFGLVQEYIPGLSLQQLLQNKKHFTETETKDIANQLLDILIYLHELSPPVLHRDIKPSNIVYDQNRQVYLVDFGAVQDKAKAEGVTFIVVGTAGYAAPEQLWGRAIPASDLFALGATLIHLLTGVSPADLPQRKMLRQFSDKLSLSPSFSQWLSKLTDPAIEERFHTARQAKTALNDSISATQTAEEGVKGNNQKGIVWLVGYLTLLSFLLFIITMCFIAWFLSLLDGSNKSREVEGRLYILSMNNAQQAYYEKKGKFVTKDSPQGWAELAVGIKPEMTNYKYSFHGTKRSVYSYAITRKEKIKSYVGAVFIVGNPSNETTKAIVCETQSSGFISFLPRPFLENGNPTCDSGTVKTLYYKPPDR